MANSRRYSNVALTPKSENPAEDLSFICCTSATLNASRDLCRGATPSLGPRGLNGSWCNVSFSNAGLRPSSEYTGYFGEVGTASATATITDMGSGASAGNSPPLDTYTASMHDMEITPSGSQDDWQWIQDATGTLSNYAEDRNCYNVHVTSIAPGSDNTIYYGGSGANAFTCR